MKQSLSDASYSCSLFSASSYDILSAGYSRRNSPGLKVLFANTPYPLWRNSPGLKVLFANTPYPLLKKEKVIKNYKDIFYISLHLYI